MIGRVAKAWRTGASSASKGTKAFKAGRVVGAALSGKMPTKYQERPDPNPLEGKKRVANLAADRAGIHNHALAGGFGLKFSKRHGWLMKDPNSWSEKWGQKGYFWCSEGAIQGNYGQIIAIVSVNVKRDLNPPNVA